MFLLTYSREIFYIVLSFCILWVSVFLIWFVYYLIATIRDIRKVTRDAKNIVAKIHGVVDLLKSKVEFGANYLSLFIDGFNRVKDAVQSEDPNKKTKKTSAKTEKKSK